MIQQTIMRIFNYFIICMLSFNLASCSSFQSVENPKVPIAKKWKLLSIKEFPGEKMIMPQSNKIPTLEIINERKFSGYTGCNSFSGNLTIVGDSIKFESIGCTLKLCHDTQRLEDLMLQTLRKIDNYVINIHGYLVLKNGYDVLITFSPA